MARSHAVIRSAAWSRPSSSRVRSRSRSRRHSTGLPPEFAVLLDSVAVVVEDLPTPDQARDADGDPDGWLYGIYDGTPLNTWGADQVPFPNVITLFRIPLEEDFPDPDELAWEIERTVVHELAHHAGIDDARLTELGYD